MFLWVPLMAYFHLQSRIQIPNSETDSLYYAEIFHSFGFGLWSPDWNVCNWDRDLSLG